MKLIIGWLIQENSAPELAKALAFVNPEAILESDEDGIYTVLSDGVAIGFGGDWVSKPIHSTNDMLKMAEAIKFANPAAECTVDRYRVTVRCDRTVTRPIKKVLVPVRSSQWV